MLPAESTEVTELSEELRRLDLAMAGMVAEAEAVFASFRAREYDKAGERMASMDRRYADLALAFSAVDAEVRQIQREHLDREADAARSARFRERVVAVFVGLMVVAASVYGHRIASELKAVAIERARTLAEIERRAAALDLDLLERAGELPGSSERRDRVRRGRDLAARERAGHACVEGPFLGPRAEQRQLGLVRSPQLEEDQPAEKERRRVLPVHGQGVMAQRQHPAPHAIPPARARVRARGGLPRPRVAVHRSRPAR